MSLLRLIHIAAASVLALSAAAEEPVVRISEFSGKPVPRFESLRYSTVNGRQGPSQDHRVLWQYQRAGLPMLIVKETRGWRQVRDPDGELVWVHENMLSERPSAMVRGAETAVMRRKPEPDAPGLAKLEAGVIVTLDRCEGAWCRVEVDARRGWVEKVLLWGADPSEAGL